MVVQEDKVVDVVKKKKIPKVVVVEELADDRKGGWDEVKGKADSSWRRKWKEDTPKPAKSKKEAAARASGGSGGMTTFQAEYLWLIASANTTGAASLAIQKESQATNL
ncbi:hypothetical protein BCR33DRAFT_793203 [Rhizoclosmatium globosum]|uniref:Uncharacterized protein n=1 Tax=Rhizoclosmatium globosum TaxID=329046 RepID=A0A1Y2B2X8_9FUNG|nr:hypothetical protein BCR33DRAFT_793203 [Rhizoclosmatium globosum]|eukprot:ORY28910.1 hypothetical protein BCR33DRAFT_793203 [Rhizoclosmatium globosum]